MCQRCIKCGGTCRLNGVHVLPYRMVTAAPDQLLGTLAPLENQQVIADPLTRSRRQAITEPDPGGKPSAVVVADASALAAVLQEDQLARVAVVQTHVNGSVSRE